MSKILRYTIVMLLVLILYRSCATEKVTIEDSITIAVVSDIEGAIGNAELVADKLKDYNLDFIIIAGDNYENEQIRKDPLYPNSTNNTLEMIEGITPFAELNLPTLIIAGNHETKEVYNKALKELKKINNQILDINEQLIDLTGVNIVGLGGYHDTRFMPTDRFLITDQDYEQAFAQLEELQDQNEPTIFVTHSPPRSDGAIDHVVGIGNVGDEELTEILESDLTDIINVHGHIHEGGRNQQVYKSGISINVASITNYDNKQGPTALVLQIVGKNVEPKFI